MNQARDKDHYVRAWQNHVKELNTIQNVFTWGKDDASLEELKTIQARLFELIDKAAELEYK
jgi:hypothetical protein